MSSVEASRTGMRIEFSISAHKPDGTADICEMKILDPEDFSRLKPIPQDRPAYFDKADLFWIPIPTVRIWVVFIHERREQESGVQENVTGPFLLRTEIPEPSGLIRGAYDHELVKFGFDPYV